ncbi:DUF5955 family protein [Streptomyces sp. S.PB5]|uniref:DUF5955 family protein n=1 Tax=Streptomyces sp. S.PB5 TaxID=3020844 RepID=UPI0025AF64C2|nr:DUF5955 family protein [Streptomyces sp. S.PB5]MDN3026449.1 DUF5955 family protein [Streptomyces sp. S.PB5]
MQHGDHISNVTGHVFSRVEKAEAGDYYAAGPPQDPRALELQSRMEELERQIAQYAVTLPNAGQLRELTEALNAQLQQGRPNRTIVRSLLDSLTAGAGGVAAVLSAVNGVAALIP